MNYPLAQNINWNCENDFQNWSLTWDPTVRMFNNKLFHLQCMFQGISHIGLYTFTPAIVPLERHKVQKYFSYILYRHNVPSVMIRASSDMWIQFYYFLASHITKIKLRKQHSISPVHLRLQDLENLRGYFSRLFILIFFMSYVVCWRNVQGVLFGHYRLQHSNSFYS